MLEISSQNSKTATQNRRVYTSAHPATFHGRCSRENTRYKVVAFGTPTTPRPAVDLGKLSKALHALKQDEVSQIQPLFITVAPQTGYCETDGRLQRFFRSNPHWPNRNRYRHFQGRAPIWGYDQHGAVDQDGHYDIDHPSNIYLVAKDGDLIRTLPVSTKLLGIASAMRKALSAD